MRYTWAGFLLFVILSSLIGDTTILVATNKYKAIKLHRVIVTIIQHIAVCDLLVVTLDVLPKFASIIANQWAFGHVVCYVVPYASYYVNVASTILICIMTTFKLLLIKHPLRFRTTSSKTAHMFCAVGWGLAMMLPVTELVDWRDIYFSYVFYTCRYGFSSNIWKYLLPLLALIGFLPICLVVATSVNLLLVASQVARRERKSLKWQGITTTVLTASVFCASWLPWLVALALNEGIRVKEYGTVRDVNLVFPKIARSFVYLNTMSNFYIYCLTLTSFRNFVRFRFQVFYRSRTLSTLSTYQGTKIFCHPNVLRSTFLFGNHLMSQDKISL